MRILCLSLAEIERLRGRRRFAARVRAAPPA
jgi:hypothetical protein